MRRWRGLTGGAALLALLSATGCVGTASIEPPAPAAEARPGGTLRVGILEPRTVAPWLTTTFDPYGSLIVETMCDSLFELDHQTGETLPALVERWKVPDPSQLIAKLRKDLRFSDGTKADAEDISTSYARAVKSETASPVAEVLEPVGGWDELRELPAAGQDPRLRDRLDGVRSPEPTSIEVSVGGVPADYYTVLAHPLGAVVSYDEYRDDPAAMERQPLCIGPYALAEPWEPGQPVITLIRSEAYHAQNAAYTRGGQGWADVIEFHVLPDAGALRQAFKDGRVDVTYLADELVAETRQELGDQVVVAELPVVEYLGLPVKVEPWSNPDVRKAVSLALDRQVLADTLFGGVTRPADGFVPTALGVNYTSGDARATTACATTVPDRADVDAAREALRAAGVDLAGSTITIAFNDEYANRQLVEAVAEQLRNALGVTVELEPQGWETYLSTGTSTSGFKTPFRLSWAAQYPDPSEYLGPLFSRETLSGENFSRYTSKEVDDLIEDAAELVNREDRQEVYLEAENLLCLELPMIPLLFGGRAYLLRHGAVGSSVDVTTDLTTGQPLLRELYLRQ